MSNIEKLISTAKAEIGYLEKASNASLDNKTANAGSNNYTKYWVDYKAHTGYNLQAQAWCACFVSEMFVSTFGLDTAKKLLCGSLYHYCPDGVNQFKNNGQWISKGGTPKAGDVIFFFNGTRAYHTGIVSDVRDGLVYTIEGNTSGGNTVIANGGGVFAKSYPLSYDKIYGYGRPNYDEIVKTGWIQVGNAWYYYKNNVPVKNDWLQDGGKWYWLDGNGVMLANDWYKYKNDWYYFLENGEMAAGLQLIKNKWYYFMQDGRLQTGAVKFTTDENGALVYPT